MKQLSFLEAFAAAAEEAASAHLPSSIEAALPFYRNMLDRYHAAMVSGEVGVAARIEQEANQLARHLNNGDAGILADDDAPGNVLRRETAAAPGHVPLWGQAGEFVIAVEGLKVRIETKGIFSVGGASGFSAHAVAWDRPFLSATGFCSFLGITLKDATGMAFDDFATEIVRAHVAQKLKGRLREIEPRYRPPERPVERLDVG